MARTKSVDIIPSDIFTYDKESNQLLSELSTLKSWDLFRPIYDDACDAGFAVQSTRTSKIVTFFHSKEERDEEGELIAHIFEMIPEDARHNPKVRIRIFND